MTVKARIIADSINSRGTRLTTFELEYPRIIHSELLTHRVFSRNGASSRAIPVNTMLDLIEANPAMPSHWGKNQPGMQAQEELGELEKESVKQLWLSACKSAVNHARVMNDIKAHKQVINRITEPYQHMKVVLTGTDFANWFWLRDHTDADPTIADLAGSMSVSYNRSNPELLRAGEWHLPYVASTFKEGKQVYYASFDSNEEITLEQALMISSSSAAQVSYRKTDGSLEKAQLVYDRLVHSTPVHASPFEHCAMCFGSFEDENGYWIDGITHVNREGVYFSGNLRDWIQYRQLLPNNVKQEHNNKGATNE